MKQSSKGRFTIFILSMTIILILVLLGILVVDFWKNFNEDVQTSGNTLDIYNVGTVIGSQRNNEATAGALDKIQPGKIEAIDPAKPKQEFADNNYHYSQIDNTAKKIYDKLNNNIEEMKSGTYQVNFGREFNDLLHKQDGKEQLNKSYQEAIDAIRLDYPEYFFLDIEKLVMTVSSTTINDITTHEVKIGNSEESYLEEPFKNKNDVDVAVRAVRNFRYQATVGGDPYKIIKEAHDWLIDSMSYDSTLSNQNIRDIYGALSNKLAVCEGYAKAFKYIMDGANIPCIIVIGNGVNEQGQTESHAWNYVKINGNWYGVDVTWDDPIISGGGKLQDKDRYRYFLKGKNFLNNHIPTGLASDTGIAFTYPELTKDF